MAPIAPGGQADVTGSVIDEERTQGDIAREIAYRERKTMNIVMIIGTSMLGIVLLSLLIVFL